MLACQYKIYKKDPRLAVHFVSEDETRVINHQEQRIYRRGLTISSAILRRKVA